MCQPPVPDEFFLKVMEKLGANVIQQDRLVGTYAFKQGNYI